MDLAWDIFPGHYIYMAIAILLSIFSIGFMVKALAQVFDPEEAEVQKEGDEVVVG